MELKLCEEYKQSTYTINSLAEDQTLTGMGEGVISRISLPPIPVVQSYLIVILSRDPTYTSFTKWKISLNNIILTREFKPHIDMQIGEKLAQSLFIYDVTKTISRDVNLKIGYEGKKPIKLDAAVLISIHRYEEFYLGFNFIMKILNLNSSIELPKAELSFKPTERRLNMGIVAEKACTLELEVIGNLGRSTKHGLMQGFNMVEVPIEGALNIDSINTRCNSSSARHIFTCLFSLYSNYPTIDVKSVEMLEDGVSLTLYNTGTTSADDIELVFLRHGVQVYRFRIGGVKPGEEKAVLLPKNIARMNNVTARVIWYKALRMFSKDLNINIG
ncbi:MAG: hypothetical protein QXV81_02530 [Ignisphaera sp.]